MSKSRVLVVDDDPAFVIITRAVLEAAHYEVDSAANRDEALCKIRKSRPDLLLLDVVMNQVLEGVGICSEIARNADLRGLPIIFVTSIRDSEYRAAFPQDIYLPVDAWVFKPYEPDDLLAKVDRILRPEA